MIIVSVRVHKYVYVPQEKAGLCLSVKLAPALCHYIQDFIQEMDPLLLAALLLSPKVREVIFMCNITKVLTKTQPIFNSVSDGAPFNRNSHSVLALGTTFPLS